MISSSMHLFSRVPARPHERVAWTFATPVICKVCLATCMCSPLLQSHLCPAAPRQKTDIVYMNNGDKLTCEIKSLEQGQLSVKPDYTMSTIVLDWTKVDRLESSQLFVIIDSKRHIYTGLLAAGPISRTMTIVRSDSKILTQESVVQITELGSTFFRKLSGNISIGTSFARSNSEANLAVQSGLTYQSQNSLAKLAWNSQFATQQKTSNTNETTVKTAYFKRLRSSEWYGGAIANFLSSTEQKIALQSTLGGALARRVIYTNRTNLSGIGGLAYTNQRNSSGSSGPARNHSLDAALAVDYMTFRFDTTTFKTDIWLYPGLTSPGRLRMTLNQNIYYKFPNNLYISLSFYDNYDNQPVQGAPENNFGGTTTIGWTFP